MNLAALDLGSRSFHLLIAQVTSRGDLRRKAHFKDAVRLGAQALSTRELPPAAVRRAVEAMRSLRAASMPHDPQVFLTVATSAIREAPNRRALLRAARDEAGIDVRVLDGVEEARLSFIGACTSVAPLMRARPALVVDVGGGSTELAIGENNTCRLARSIPLGTLRVGPRHTRPWSKVEREMTAAHCEAALASGLGRMASAAFKDLILTSGTARALARLTSLDGAGEYGERRLRLEDLREMECLLARLSVHERRLIPGLDPMRAEVILAGAIILRTVLEMLGRDGAVVSRGGLREGVLIDYLRREGSRPGSIRLAA